MEQLEEGEDDHGSPDPHHDSMIKPISSLSMVWVSLLGQDPLDPLARFIKER